MNAIKYLQYTLTEALYGHDFIYTAFIFKITVMHDSYFAYKAFRHVENLFIQRFLFVHPMFVFIVQGSLLILQ